MINGLMICRQINNIFIINKHTILKLTFEIFISIKEAKIFKIIVKSIINDKTL